MKKSNGSFVGRALRSLVLALGLAGSSNYALADSAQTQTKNQVSAGYFMGFGNIKAGETKFSNSPSQKHDLSADLQGFRIGVSRDMGSFNLSVNYFYGQGSDSGRTQSYGTDGLVGSAWSDVRASVNGAEAVISKDFGKSDIRINGYASVGAALVDGRLEAIGSVSSDGTKVIGNSLDSKLSGVVFGARVGVNAELYLTDRLSVFGGASMGVGTEQSYDKTTTQVSGAITGSGTGETTEGVNVFGKPEINAGLKFSF